MGGCEYLLDLGAPDATESISIFVFALRELQWFLRTVCKVFCSVLSYASSQILSL